MLHNSPNIFSRKIMGVLRKRVLRWPIESGTHITCVEVTRGLLRTASDRQPLMTKRIGARARNEAHATLDKATRSQMHRILETRQYFNKKVSARKFLLTRYFPHLILYWDQQAAVCSRSPVRVQLRQERDQEQLTGSSSRRIRLEPHRKRMPERL